MGEHETRVGCEVCKALGNIVRHLQKLTRLHLGLASGPLRRAEDDAGARLKPYPLLRAQKHGRVLAPRRGISRSRLPRVSSIVPGGPPLRGSGGALNAVPGPVHPLVSFSQTAARPGSNVGDPRLRDGGLALDDLSEPSPITLALLPGGAQIGRAHV